MSRESRAGSNIPRDIHFDRSNPEEGLVPTIPTYRIDLSQLSLPPEYASDSNMPGESEGRASAPSGERRGASDRSGQSSEGSQSTHHHEASDNDSGPDAPSSPSSRKGEMLNDGSILVDSKTNGKSDNVRTVHYPDEHGGLLHAMPSPSYPDPSFPSGHKAVRMFTSTSMTEDEFDDADELYDWSDEEDLVDQEARFDQKLSSAPKKKRAWGPRRIATFFVSTLIGSTILAGLLAAVPILVHFLYYVPHRTPHREWVKANVSAWFYWAASNLLISWYLAFIVDAIPHLVTWGVSISWGSVSESFKSKIALYDAFRGWIKPVLYAASAWVSWVIIFANIYGLHNTSSVVTSRAAYTDRLYEVVEFLFFLVLLVSLEKILLQTIAFTFHRVAFESRLEEVAKAIKVLDRLKDYKPKRRTHGANRSSAMGGLVSGLRTIPLGLPFGFSSARPSDTALPHETHGLMGASRPSTPDPGTIEDGFAADTEDYRSYSPGKKEKQRKTWFGARAVPKSTGSQQSSRDISRTPSADLINATSTTTHTYPPIPEHRRADIPTPPEDTAMITHAAKAIKNVILHDARNIKGKTEGNADLAFTLSSPHEAKKLARDLYYAFRADRRRAHLIPSDFFPAYKNPDEAKAAFSIFDRDGNENITRAEIKTTIMKIYKERRFLARSLQDVRAALVALDMIMLLFVLVIVFIISLSVFKLSIGKMLTSFYTLGLAMSFIFKSTASNAFDAIMFLFVTHPFDSGDRCFIDTENLVVKKMGLFATTFTRADGTQTYYFNSQLFTKFITNVRRSGKMFENLTMQVNWRIPLAKLDELEKRMNHWMETDENRWFAPPTSIMLQKIDYQRNLEITIGIPYNGNWQDWGATLNRRTAFHAAANHYCKELGITWGNSPQPILFANPEDSVPPLADGGDSDEEEEEASSPLPGAPPKATLFFLPPADEAASGVRHRKTRKNGLRGNIGS